MPTKVIHKQLTQRKINTTTPSVIYTCPDDSTTTYIHTIIATNIDTVARTYSLYLNPNSNTAASGDLNTLFDAEQLFSKTHDLHTFPDDCALILNKSGASLMASASSVGTIVISVFGKEVIET